MKNEIEEFALPFVAAVLDKKTEGVIALDVSKLTSVADVFIIGSGRSVRQVKAIAGHVRRKLREKGKKSLNIDGENEGNWVLLDYGDVVIHLFLESTRRFYDLEGLWMDAPKILKDFIDKKISETVYDDDEEDDDFWSSEENEYEEY
ncbi:MAG: ribosome silencing factor [Desulforegulaceae bacterium]|nr:ribosome silencing factor [Desulforegulaceae bacterium]